MHLLKKILFKTHQVTGIILSLMFFVWFTSGLVLIFAGFPHASLKERFLFLKPFSQAEFTQIKPLVKSDKGDIELEKLNDNRPVYRVSEGRRAQKIYDAVTLQPIHDFTEQFCQTEAEQFVKSSVQKTKKINELDQWMPWSYYNPLLPMYKFYMNDSQHSVIYVSTKTGEIVQQTIRKTRWLARIGAIPHWIYFSSLRLQVERWNQTVIWLSIFGLVASITGIAVGIIRLNNQKRRKKTGSISPYKNFWFKWHHILGFFFGIFVCTFLLSGMFSVVNFSNGKASNKKEFSPKRTWNKGKKGAVNAENSFAKLWKALQDKDNVRKLEWDSSMGKSAWFVYYNDYQTPKVYITSADTIFQQPTYSLTDMKSRASKLFKGTSYQVIKQDKYDNYYKASGMFARPLPVYKISWNNSVQDEIYIDPNTGKAIQDYNQMSKLHRWLYQGLHKLDFPFLSQHNWLRKSLLVLLSIAGIWLSITSIVLSWKWVLRKIKKIR